MDLTISNQYGLFMLFCLPKVDAAFINCLSSVTVLTYLCNYSTLHRVLILRFFV